MLKTLALAACLVGAAADPVDQAIYPGRSGDVAFAAPAGQAARLIFVGAEKVATGAKSFAETSMAPLVAHIAGALPTAFPASMPKAAAHVLTPAKGMLMLSLEGVSAAELESMPAVSRIAGDSHSVDLEPAFEPRDSVAAAVSRTTGTTPDDHGIAAKAWVDAKTSEIVAAFTAGKDATAARVAGLADLIGQSSQGRSFLLSMSSDAQLAAANGAHPSMCRNHAASWPHAVLSYDAEAKAFKPSQIGDALDASRFTVTLADARAALHKVAPEELAALESEDPVAVAGVIAELGSPLVLMARLAVDPVLSPLVGDDAADLVTISLAAVSGHKTTAALKLADKAVPAILDAYRGVWGDKARAAILLNPETAAAPAVDAPAGWTVVGSRAFGPRSPEGKAEGCAHFASALEGSETQVHCLLHRQGGARRRLQEEEEFYTGPTVYSSDQLELFQVTLWTSVIIAVALLVGSCSLYNMEVHHDSLLFTKEKGM